MADGTITQGLLLPRKEEPWAQVGARFTHGLCLGSWVNAVWTMKKRPKCFVQCRPAIAGLTVCLSTKVDIDQEEWMASTGPALRAKLVRVLDLYK